MEYWLTNEYHPFLILSSRRLLPLTQHSNIPKPIIALKLHCVPNIPSFQHSNRTTLRLSTGWGEAPNLKLQIGFIAAKSLRWHFACIKRIFSLLEKILHI